MILITPSGETLSFDNASSISGAFSPSNPDTKYKISIGYSFIEKMPGYCGACLFTNITEHTDFNKMLSVAKILGYTSVFVIVSNFDTNMLTRAGFYSIMDEVNKRTGNKVEYFKIDI